MDKKAMNKLSYGLFVVSANWAGRKNGCIVNTVQQVTSEPNRISVAVNKANHTHEMLMETGRMVVSVISEEADFALFQHFGFQSGKETDKFAEFKDYGLDENGIPYITKGTNAYISAKVIKTEELGTHTLFLAEVTEMEVLNEVPSVTYRFYHEHIKPDVQKKESSLQAEGLEQTGAENGQSVWKCTICGYEYVGEEVPEDFICPWCKHPASDFEKV